jgi:hypothetical protein
MPLMSWESHSLTEEVRDVSSPRVSVLSPRRGHSGWSCLWRLCSPDEPKFIEGRFTRSSRQRVVFSLDTHFRRLGLR